MTLLTVLLLASATSQAQVFTSDAAPCTLDEAYPIAGTAGLENALSALRINAQTYSASRFAEQHIFPVWEQVEAELGATGEDDLLPAYTKVAYQTNINLGVAAVPMWHANADCPDDYRFSTSPIDLFATNLGGVFRKGRVGLYYSASFTFGYAAIPQNGNRAALALPMTLITTYGVLFAPLAGPGAQIVDGGSAFSVDWLGGGIIDTRYLKARGGYARSGGLHGSIEQPQTGLFANGVVRGGGWADIEQYAAGADRVRLGPLSDKIGRSSVFARGVPLSDPIQPEGAAEPDEIQLRSGHIKQTDIGGVLDIEAAWATAPQKLLHEVWAAYHSPQFSAPGAVTSGATAFRFGGGMLQMPAQYYYGLDQRRLITARYDLIAALSDAGYVNFSLAYNDPEQLLLFPFARDAFSVRFGLEAEF